MSCVTFLVKNFLAREPKHETSADQTSRPVDFVEDVGRCVEDVVEDVRIPQ